MIVENVIPRNMIINLGCASVDNHIPRDDIFDYHPLRECNIYIICHDVKMQNYLLDLLITLKTPNFGNSPEPVVGEISA